MKETHHLFQRNGIWWVRFMRGGKQVRISAGTRNLYEAVATRNDLLGLEVRSKVSRRVLQHTPTQPAPELAKLIANAMWKRARSRAQIRGLHFLLTLDDVRLLLEKSGWRCAVSGIPFEVGRDFPRSRGPFKPSLDRIDSSKAYALSNVRIVCCAANLAMNSWGLPVLQKLAAAVMRHTNGHTTSTHS